MRNEVKLKTFWYGLCENALFPWQHPYMGFEKGGRPTNSIISRVRLILEH